MGSTYFNHCEEEILELAKQEAIAEEEGLTMQDDAPPDEVGMSATRDSTVKRDEEEEEIKKQQII